MFFQAILCSLALSKQNTAVYKRQFLVILKEYHWAWKSEILILYNDISICVQQFLQNHIHAVLTHITGPGVA